MALAISPAVQVCGQTYSTAVIAGIYGPVFATHVPNDMTRLFVAEVWSGSIQVVDLATRLKLPQPFLTLPDLTVPLSTEQGLLGLAFDPGYATNGYFYVDFTGPDNSVIVRRYRVLGDPATSNIADPASGVTILSISKAEEWHNGGWIGFGPNDGYLYVNIGDPTLNNSQDITDNLQGKILRLDVAGDDFPEDATRNYAIPPTNPFVGIEGDDEIWAFGLRNPWRASFDRVTGDLWINDVGQAAREEINFQSADSPGGENYAWPRREGTVTGYDDGELLPGDVEPVYDYPHIGPDPRYTGSTIAGSGLYRGSVAEFYGHYFFSDHGSRNIWKLDPDAVDIRASVTNVNDRLVPNVGALGQTVSFGEDARGELYLINISGSDIYRISTTSMDVTWNGSDSKWGLPGNGSAWGSALNWTRGNLPDHSFVSHDNVIFAAGPLQPHVYLGRDRTVAAITFQAPYTLHDHTLQVLSGNVTVATGVTATIASTLSAETANHSIRKLGPGTLLLEGDAGQTVVKEGTLGGIGSLDHLTVRSGGTVAPGAKLGVLTVDHSFTMEPGATFAVEIGGTDNANIDLPQFDQLLVGGAAEIAGVLDVTLIESASGTFTPIENDVFPFLSADGGVSGSFDAHRLPPLRTGLTWKLISDGVTLSLKVAARLPGDYSGDGIVDAADYVVWRNSVGQDGGFLAADGTGPMGAPDGFVDVLDYLFWRTNFDAAGMQGGLPGDYNSDGTVNAADYVVWRMQNQTGDGLDADGSGPNGSPDGVVDDIDYAFWRANFGATRTGSSGLAAVHIPEPRTVWLAAFAALFVVNRRPSRFFPRASWPRTR
jgi:glucose/arabinose dehydrogenase